MNMEERINKLEIMMSYHVETVDAMNKSLYRQEVRIEILEKEIKQLREEIKTLSSLEEPNTEPPPHY